MTEQTNKYAYFFTRQDISPEQQIVQTAHAAMKLGAAAATDASGGDRVYVQTPAVKGSFEILGAEDVKASETYFTVIGVRNLEALAAVRSILDRFGYQYVEFIEPDLGDEPTSIAVYPVDETKRGPLMAFNLLKIGGRG